MSRKVFEISKNEWTVGVFHKGELIGGCQKKFKKKQNAEKELKRLNIKYPMD
jgi:hypothetical protein